MLGGAGAEDFEADSLSSCFTVSVGGSDSFFTSTITQEHVIRGKPVDYGNTKLVDSQHHQNDYILNLRCNFKSIPGIGLSPGLG